MSRAAVRRALAALTIAALCAAAVPAFADGTRGPSAQPTLIELFFDWLRSYLPTGQPRDAAPAKSTLTTYESGGEDDEEGTLSPTNDPTPLTGDGEDDGSTELQPGVDGSG